MIAIGPFSSQVADCLGYPAERYRDTRSGSVVVTELFEIVEGNTAGTEFAAALGIADPWDFNQHKFDPASIDVEHLRALFETFAEGEHYNKELDRMLRLRDGGFWFLFMPNG